MDPLVAKLLVDTHLHQPEEQRRSARPSSRGSGVRLRAARALRRVADRVEPRRPDPVPVAGC